MSLTQKYLAVEQKNLKAYMIHFRFKIQVIQKLTECPQFQKVKQKYMYFIFSLKCLKFNISILQYLTLNVRINDPIHYLYKSMIDKSCFQIQSRLSKFQFYINVCPSFRRKQKEINETINVLLLWSPATRNEKDIFNRS